MFGHAVIKILNEFPKWKAVVIGDESREKIIFNDCFDLADVFTCGASDVYCLLGLVQLAILLV